MAGSVEFELGVPIPGRVLPREKWTRCGYSDRGGPFDWEEHFGRKAGRVLDLGCGNGRYLIGSALARPGTDHLGIDLVQRAVDFGAHRGGMRGLTNLKMVVGDAIAWLFDRLSADSIDEVHVYHPQPYYEQRDIHKRMLTPEFLEQVWRVLRRAGLLVLQTDNKPYWTYLQKAVRRHFDPTIVRGRWPDSPQGRTRREIVASKKGLTVWRMTAVRLDTPRTIEAVQPDFSADRARYRRRRRA